MENSVNLPECVAHLEKDRDKRIIILTGTRAQGVMMCCGAQRRRQHNFKKRLGKLRRINQESGRILEVLLEEEKYVERQNLSRGQERERNEAIIFTMCQKIYYNTPIRRSLPLCMVGK